MFKNLFSICVLLLLFKLSGFAQRTSPSYIDVIKTFCNSYQSSDDNTDYTCFAKKKKGWYVIQVNRLQSDRLLNEHLYFSFAENKYLNLDSFYASASNPDIDKALEKYLTKDGNTADWYGFERMAYYGYNGWYLDMIKDFGASKNLSDTMYDGLGRAYVNLANSYSWYQSGGMFPEYDTLHRKLDRLEYPSEQRIDSIKKAIDNAIERFENLRTLNPGYKTIIGNSTIKAFNEYMHGYDQMSMFGRDDLAKQYLDRAQLTEPYMLQAKNYLNSCEPNAILFSYGDNDTYQLWYVQEKYNFRKDVLVINNSLLGLPVYIDMFKRKKLLSLSIPNFYLKDQGSDIAYYVEKDNLYNSNKEIDLKELLTLIYKKKFPYDIEGTTVYPTYPYLNVSLSLPVSWNQPSASSSLKKIPVAISKEYHFVNDIAMLDIIANNIHKRPVYFTTLAVPLFENNLVQMGIVYKLIAGDINSEMEKNTEIRILEKFINEKYIPVLSNDSTLISFDGDNTFFSLFYKILGHYLAKKDTKNLNRWLTKLETICPEFNATQINVARSLSYYFIEAGNTAKALAIIDQYARWLTDAYTNPNSLKGFYFKENYISELSKIQEYLTSKGLKSKLVNSLLKQ